MKAVEKLVPFWFTPKSELKEKPPTRFRLRGLKNMEYLSVMPMLFVERGKIHATAEGTEQMLKYCLLGWENFNDSKGEVKFGDDMEANIERLPVPVVIALATAILNSSRLTGDEVKN